MAVHRVCCPRCHSFETMCGWEHKGSSFYLCRNCERTWSVSERSDLIAALNLCVRNRAPTLDIDVTKDRDAACSSCPYMVATARH